MLLRKSMSFGSAMTAPQRTPASDMNFDSVTPEPDLNEEGL